MNKNNITAQPAALNQATTSNTTTISSPLNAEKDAQQYDSRTAVNTNVADTTAGVRTDDGNVQSDKATVIELTKLQENEQNAIDCIAKGIEAGKYLNAIRDDNLYVHRINPKTQKSYTWEAYCYDVLKVSLQYVDRKIIAWETREMVKRQIDKDIFDELPLTVSIWVELHKRAEDERIDVLQGLIAKFRKEGNSLGRLQAKDIRDYDSSEGNNEDDDEGRVVTDEVAAASEEPWDAKQLAKDVANGRPADISSLSPLNREELRMKLEAMLEESREVQSNIETFLKKLDTDAAQSTEQCIEEGAAQVA